jgi:hypothetical protein
MWTHDKWFFPMGLTIGEIMLIGQMRNSGATNGLGMVFKVTDHVGFDIIQSRVGEV